MGSVGNSDETLPIAIIGGGLAGLALANGLNRKGVAYKIYEATKKFSEIGAGISFLPNAIQALQLIDPDLFESFQDMITYDESTDVSQLRVYCGMTELSQYRYGNEILRIPKINEYDKGRCGAHRARLLDALIKYIPPNVAEFNKSMSSIVELDDRVEISFTDGTKAQAAAAICCDGIKSGARAHVLGKDDPAVEPRYAGAYAYRALVSREEAVKILGSEHAGDGHMWIGRGRYIFQYPVDKGALINVIAVVVQPGSAWSAPSFYADCTIDDILKDFEGFGEPLRELLQTTEYLKRWALFELPPVRTYTKGRICLLGDAAHATTSHQGAGGSAAFEDAYVMAELLGDAEMRSDLPRALAAYDSVRCARGNRVVSSSNDQGLVFTLQRPDLGDDLGRFEENMRQRYQWLWNEDLPAEVERAKAWFHKAHGA